MSVSFLTDREQLREWLPEGFALGAEAVVTVRATYIKNIEWLAGRGYNKLGVSFPAVYGGNEDHISGNFLAVLWENLTDPILTGREELGYPKIFCELPEPQRNKGETHCVASWMGFNFLDLKIGKVTKLSRKEVDAYRSELGEGILCYKYIPKTGEWGESDIAYATLTPSGESNAVIEEIGRGEGTVQFHKSRWADLPTMFNIVNALHNLEIKEYRGAMRIKSVGGKDISDARILR
jgi:hypothetical protein